MAVAVCALGKLPKKRTTYGDLPQAYKRQSSIAVGIVCRTVSFNLGLAINLAMQSVAIQYTESKYSACSVRSSHSLIC